MCLFGYGRVGRVPVDVWIERLIRDEFAGQDPFPQFGLEAGIVQQYLFFIKEAWDKNRGAAGRSVGSSDKQKGNGFLCLRKTAAFLSFYRLL